MAKKTEPKFRVVRLALSNDAFSLLESSSKTLKVSKSMIITKLLERTESPLGVLDVLASQIEIDAEKIRNPNGQDALVIRSGELNNQIGKRDFRELLKQLPATIRKNKKDGYLPEQILDGIEYEIEELNL